MRTFATRVTAVVVAVAVYGAISWAVWLANPGPYDTKDDEFTRWYLSAFWSTGLIDITGNWSSVSCGY